jgi:hypothetical protein
VSEFEIGVRWIRIIIIIIIIGLFNYADLSMCQDDDDVDWPSGSGGPPVDLNISLLVNKSEVYRGAEVEFTYTITPEKNLANQISLKIKVPENFLYIRSYPIDFRSDNMGYLIFKRRDNLNVGEPLIISYTARALLNASTGDVPINRTIVDVDWRGPHARGDCIKSVSNQYVCIKNNAPEILSAGVTVLSEPPTPVYNHTLLFKFRGDYEPIRVELDVNVVDDDENLTYTLIAEPLNLELFSSNEPVQTFSLRDLNPGNYRFKVRVNDSYEEDVIDAIITHDEIVYDKLIISTINVSDTIRALSIFFVFMVLFILGFIKKYFKNFLKSTTWIFVLIAVVLTTHFLVWLIYLKNIFHDALWPVYATSYEIFITSVFIIIFAIIAKFSESCFAEYDRISKGRKYLKYLGGLTYNLWYVNVFTMTALLVSVALIVPSFNINTNAWEQYLQWYYSTMAQVFASILAIVVVFYTALPNKNIIILDVEERNILKNKLYFRLAQMCQNWPYKYADRLGFNNLLSKLEERIAKISKEDNLEVKVKYGHPEILRLFVIIYGIILVLSFFGLSSCVYIDFSRLNPFIDLSWDNLPNLISLANFEITLLLIPAAISCLYALMRITAFTGTIELISYPSGAKIFLIKKEYIEKPGKPHTFDTKLITPSKLMLPEGNYIIILKKDDYGEHITKSVDIIAGTEQQYKYKLEKI